MQRIPTIAFVFILLGHVGLVKGQAGHPLRPEIVEVRRIWDSAPHNAFTDLVRWRDRLYCAFREGKGHAGDIGKLRVIVSDDGKQWRSAALLSMDDYDLRDAAISLTPDDRLMVLGGAQQDVDGTRRTGTFVSFSKDGESFTAPKVVVPPGRWLWRVTWHEGTAYGVSYATPDGRPFSALHKTKDGLKYETVTDRLLGEGGWPTEARVRFAADGTCYCLHRRDGEQNSAYLGVSRPPYTQWKWHDLKHRLGGPNFIQLPSGHWIGAGRLYDGGARTELVQLDVEKGSLKPMLRLPSGGDTSYPGMVWHDDHLWMSYYSSHEGKTSIYLAKIRLNGLETETSAIEIGRRRELFVDNHLIDEMHSAELRLHAPRAEEVVLRFDKPWEGAFCGYVTVLQDGETYRMYYRGLPTAGRDGTSREVTCYAESQDGIHWEKPQLNLYEIDGSRKNNIVLHGQAPASHNFSPFVDRNPQAPEDQRYKALAGTRGLIAFVSADGLKWRRLQKDPVVTKGAFDSQNVSFWSEVEQQYVCYFRTWTKTNYGGFRTISRTTSKDFVSWSEPVQMSFGDTKLEHLYTNQTHPYFRAPHLYVAVAARFMPGRRVLSPQDATNIGVNRNYFGDCSDAVLLTSRGGTQYDRTFLQSWIRPGLGLENWVSRTNYPALGIIPTSDTEMSLYVQKNYGQPTSHLRRYRMRIDGFASVNAGYGGGEMRTKPIAFASAEAGDGPTRELCLNFGTSAAGSIQVELQDEAGVPISGFTLDDCEPIIGDRIERIVSWKGESDVSSLAGRAIRFRFVMKDADLYSMQIR